MSPMFKNQTISPRMGITTKQIKALTSLDSNYIVGPGDLLGVTVEDTYLQVQVSFDNKIHFENIAPMEVKGLTLGETERLIKQNLKVQFDENSIGLSVINKKDVYISVYGAVHARGHFSIQDGANVSQVFLMAGDFNESADIPGSQLMRLSGDTLSIDPSAKFYNNDLSQNPSVELGDIIYVPFVDLGKPLVYLREKDRFRPATYRDGWTIKRYLYGYQLHRWTDGLEAYQVKRGDSTIVVPLSEYDTFVLESGDRLESIEVEQVVLVGGVINKAGKISYQKHLTPIEYVSQAGINAISQHPDQFKVLRRSGYWEWIDPHSGVLYPGDFIQIEKNQVESAKDYSTITATFLNVITSSLAIYLAAKGL